MYKAIKSYIQLTHDDKSEKWMKNMGLKIQENQSYLCRSVQTKKNLTKHYKPRLEFHMIWGVI